MLHSVTHRMVDIGPLKLHCAEAGPEGGEPVILLHGFPEFWWSWRKQIPALSGAGFRVVAPDMRGYGNSGCPEGVSAYQLDRLVKDVIALADALGFQTFALVGHDWGGIVAWAVAARHPERLRKLVILNAPHLDTMSEIIRRRPQQLLRSSYVGFFQLPGVPELVLGRKNFEALGKALTGSSRRGTFTDEDLAHYKRQWALPGRLTSMLNYYRALVRRRHEPLGPITLPVRMLWGRRDQALHHDLAVASIARCPNGELLTHDRATHWIHLEEPEWVSGQIVDFLQPVPSAPGTDLSEERDSAP